MADYQTVTLPDGARLAYEILGAQHIGHATPLVLVGGMACRRGDWERLSTVLAQRRPILLFDHRGIGDSTSAEDNEITVESLARDILFLLSSLGWKELGIVGYSMGGALTQQLILLPYHPAHPTPLPFRVSHVFLTATMATVLRDKRYGLPLPELPKGPKTDAELKESFRPTVEATLDQGWIGDPANKEKLQWLIDRSIVDKPLHTILKQKRAMGRFDFGNLHEQLPRDMKILVIHGEIDRVIPFACGQEILQRIPWASMVTVGHSPGSVPSYEFGHAWWEYFDVQVWRDVVETFLRGESNGKSFL